MQGIFIAIYAIPEETPCNRYRI